MAPDLLIDGLHKDRDLAAKQMRLLQSLVLPDRTGPRPVEPATSAPQTGEGDSPPTAPDDEYDDTMDLIAYVDRAMMTGRPQLPPAYFGERGVPRELRATALDVEGFTHRVSAAPGRRLTASFSGSTAFFIARQGAVDAEGTASDGLEVRQAIAFKLCAAMCAENLDEFLGERARDALLALARHEVDEWLRIDGERVRDPHPHEGLPRSRWVAPPACPRTCWCAQ